MRTWIGGGLLAAVTAGGLFFVASGMGNPSHCGVCVSTPSTATETPSDCSQGACPTVVEVVDIPAMLRRPKPTESFVSFEEPPLASPRNETSPVMIRTAPGSDVRQATFIEPIGDENGPEIAPRPRKVAAPGQILLASPNDPF